MENSDVKLLTVCVTVSPMCISSYCCEHGICDGWKWGDQKRKEIKGGSELPFLWEDSHGPEWMSWMEG